MTKPGLWDGSGLGSLRSQGAWAGGPVSWASSHLVGASQGAAESRGGEMCWHMGQLGMLVWAEGAAAVFRLGRGPQLPRDGVWGGGCTGLIAVSSTGPSLWGQSRSCSAGTETPTLPFFLPPSPSSFHYSMRPTKPPVLQSNLNGVGAFFWVTERLWSWIEVVCHCELLNATERML